MPAKLPTIFALALAGCAGVADRNAFRLPADEVQAAWLRGLQPEEREAEEANTYPPGVAGPFFSEATCRWIERERRAVCSYRVSTGIVRPGSARHWEDEQAEFELSGTVWSIASSAR